MEFCPRPNDPIPKLSPENEKVWRFFEDRVAPGLFGSNGTFNYSAVEFAFRVYRIPSGQRPILMDLILEIIGVIRALREKKNGNKA